MHKTKPFIIGICGNSGCGKTALAERIETLLGKKNTLTISCDDYHKWARGDINWKKYTHLDPRANNLSLMAKDLSALKSGESITKYLYCHCEGKFLGPHKVFPKKYIIVEGLHPFFTAALRKIFDFKIFLHIDPKLNAYFKICRDVHQRGHTRANVIKSIEFRQKDLKKYILPQTKYADMIIEKHPILKLDENKNDTAVEYVFKHNKKINLKNLHNILKTLIPQKTQYDAKKDTLRIPRILTKEEIKKIQKLALNKFKIKLDQNIYCLSQLLISYNLAARGAKIGRLSRTYR